MLTLGQLDLDRRDLSLNLRDDTLDGVNNAANALTVAGRAELAIDTVQGELDIRTTSSLDEDVAAGLDERDDVSRNVANALGRLGRLGSNDRPEDVRGLLRKRLSASDADRDGGLLAFLVNGSSSTRASVSVSMAVDGGEVVATRDVDPDVDLVTDLLEVGT